MQFESRTHALGQRQCLLRIVLLQMLLQDAGRGHCASSKDDGVCLINAAVRTANAVDAAWIFESGDQICDGFLRQELKQRLLE